MARRKSEYYYQAFFKPNSLELFEGFSTGLGLDKRGLGYAQAWHRGNVETHTIVNEFVCGHLGQFLRLPIPPFAITRFGGELLFSSLDFNFERAKLPAVEPDRCVQRMLNICTGVLLFDILVANEDRHDKNLVVDRVSRPRRMHVFDHDQALFSGYRRSGIERLKHERERLGIIKEMMSGEERPHVFLETIPSARYFEAWIEKVSDIPRWMIDELCDFCVKELGLTTEESEEAKEFLVHRRNNLEQLVRAHSDRFSRVTDWPWRNRLC